MATKASPRSSAAKATTAPRKRTAPQADPAPRPVVVAEAAPEAVQPDLKRQELLAQVVARSGVKKKFAKPVMEAMLEVLGGTLSEGRELNLPPLGKVKLNRTKDGARARVIVAKIRQSKQGGNTLPGDGGEENDTAVKEMVADPGKGR